MPDLTLRSMRPDEWGRVAELICDSTNRWYQAGNKPAIFPGGPSSCLLFCETYEDLDPGCCVVAEDNHSGKIVGSCSFGRGIAGRLLCYIIEFAQQRQHPVRLVSSAMNLDSFSLYNRNGFVPRKLYQDMFVPSTDQLPRSAAGYDQVRDARLEDVSAIMALEDELVHIRREKDYRYFIENRRGIWHTSVFENARGGIDGFLVSIAHPGSNMLGPGVMRSEEQAAALILKELHHRTGATPVFLAPVESTTLVQTLYSWGARNCELHFSQVRGDYQAPAGVVMPTFMPETG
jgi:hypothetical protein